MSALPLRPAACLAILLAGCPPAAPTWEEAFDASKTGWLLDVWGPADDDLWATGGAPDAGVLMHFDGSAWTRATLPEGVPLLTWAWGFSARDVTVVGNEGTVLHYDGATWTRQATPTRESIWGVWGAAPNDLWAVGGSGYSDGAAVILHYDGATWTTAAVPVLQRPQVFAFYKVWGTSASNVYVVGQRGVVLHWNGTAWLEEFAGASDDLVSLWGTGPDDIVSVGGRSSGIVTRWDGTHWTATSLSPAPGLNGVWMRDRGTAWVGGELGTLGSLDLTTMTLTREGPSTTLLFHGVFGTPGGRIYAVGGSFQSIEPPYVGLAYSRSTPE